MAVSSDIPEGQCPLCLDKQVEMIIPDINARIYWRCDACCLIFMDKSFLPGPDKEKARYDLHQNKITDTNYLAFINPMIESIKPFINKTKKGLDYGCGPNPVLADHMRNQEFNIVHFDPYYYPLSRDQTYDYITCTEVVEHFHMVDAEWSKMISMLKCGGYLGIMTHVYDEVTDLHQWYYMRDFTHTSFYHSRTLSFIAHHWKLKLCMIRKNRLAIFRKI